MKSILLIAAFLLSLLAPACEPVQEPWTRSGNQLESERARSREAEQVLRHRFLRVQTDR